MDSLHSTISPLSWLLNMSYVAAFLGTLAYLGFQPESIGIFVVLVVLDVIFGTIRAAIVDGCGTVRSAILSKGIIAKMLLLGVPVTCALGLKGVGFSPDLLAQSVVNVLILSETYSVLGNIHSAMYKVPKNEFDAVQWILRFIKKLLDRALRDNVIS